MTAPTPAGSAPAPDGPGADPTVTTTRRRHLDEDWLATVVGLVLLGLVLTGVIGVGVIP